MGIQNPHDKFFKEVFGKVEVARDFFTNYLPQSILNIIDLKTIELQLTFQALLDSSLLSTPIYFHAVIITHLSVKVNKDLKLFQKCPHDSIEILQNTIYIYLIYLFISRFKLLIPF
jgi:hypothetical protein